MLSLVSRRQNEGSPSFRAATIGELLSDVMDGFGGDSGVTSGLAGLLT